MDDATRRSLDEIKRRSEVMTAAMQWHPSGGSARGKRGPEAAGKSTPPDEDEPTPPEAA